MLTTSRIYRLYCCAHGDFSNPVFLQQVEWNIARISFFLWCWHQGWNMHVCSRTIAHQAPLSMGLSWQEYWSWLPFPPPSILLTEGLNPHLLQFLHWQVDSLPCHHQRDPRASLVSRFSASTSRLWFSLATLLISFEHQLWLHALISCFLDVEPPSIDWCRSPPPVQVSEKEHAATWDEPQFSDNSGENAGILSTCYHQMKSF